MPRCTAQNIRSELKTRPTVHAPRKRCVPLPDGVSLPALHRHAGLVVDWQASPYTSFFGARSDLYQFKKTN